MDKRAAIFAAAKRLFPRYGFEGVSMDAIAAEAGVSKLTVYSHFKDKEALFTATVRAKCEEQLPPALFLAELKGSLREKLCGIARGFFALVTSDEAIAMHRVIYAQAQHNSKWAHLFWEAGPQRVQDALAEFLRLEVGAGKLAIMDVRRAASQFICLLKGEPQARLLCGFTEPLTPRDIDAHIDATVELFLRAYGVG